jgi:hypothetical protein
MIDRGDSSLECLIEETACCLLYQAFRAAVSSIKHSRLLSPLSNIQGCCLLYQAFKPAVGDNRHECLIEETTDLNV